VGLKMQKVLLDRKHLGALLEIEKQENSNGENYDFVFMDESLVKFVDLDTFRFDIFHEQVPKDLGDEILYFNGINYGLYDKVFTNETYVYYCLNGTWY
jgi:hypothetical protein